MEQPGNNNQESAKPSQQEREKGVPSRNRFFEKEFIDSLQENVVKDILAEILRKSDNEKALDKFIPFKEITSFLDDKNQTSATFYHDTHSIELNKDKIVHDKTEHNGTELTQTITLATILHEELHALTSNELMGVKEEGVEKRQTGFQVERVDTLTQESKKVLVKFNEGITELIKDYILTEYIKRTGDSNKFILKGYEEGLSESTYQTYLEERALVNDIFMRVSVQSNVSLDVVREAFVQAYFSGMPIGDVSEVIQDICGAEVLAKMDDVETKVLNERLRKGIESYSLSSAKSKEEIDGYAKDFIVIMCTNYMKRGLVK